MIWVTIPGGMSRCGAQGQDLAMDLEVLGLQLDSMSLRVFSKWNDTMTIFFFFNFKARYIFAVAQNQIL